ncbi:serine/threonine-protein kinase [Amycolatopsis sp.]|uniref:serine/threonine-protein kinase n=1 Tax=Amycolatopsis sp. TaxID=37632 RepID=UPI002CF4651C|nr:serine/threonine-protein kinase [Amycolatopsis sp.]HVV12953.1 serine/threonine-protein kinase [Amycolatopsis sp.]
MTGTERHDDGRLIAGRYRLQRRIGGGAMGIVWLAKDELLDRTVAVKQLLLTPGLSAAEAEQARKRSAREARLAARLQHRHAITVFDVADDDGMPVLVMEYLPSRSLAEVLTAEGPLPPSEVARIGAHAASALAAAHSAGIVHRDVKPGNILLGDDGTAKITDFGISKAADDGTLTGSGRFAGTPAFLSPEAARGEKPDAASDVFSLGATLYAIVEGRFPYGDTENQMALLYAAAAGRVSPPRQAGPLTGVLAKMMHLEPAARPTMAELAAELGTLTDAPKDKRNRKPLYAGLALLVVAAAVVTTVLLTKDSGQNPNAAPPPATATATVTASATGSAPASSTAASTSTQASSSPANAPASMVQAVSDYYAIMPGQPDVGWTKLGPGLQAQGLASYKEWWSKVSSLRVTDGPRQTGADTVQVTIDYTYNGRQYHETHHLGMITRNGQTLINSDNGLGA